MVLLLFGSFLSHVSGIVKEDEQREVTGGGGGGVFGTDKKRENQGDKHLRRKEESRAQPGSSLKGT